MRDVPVPSGLFRADADVLNPGLSSGITGIKQKSKSTSRPKQLLIAHVACKLYRPLAPLVSDERAFTKLGGFVTSFKKEKGINKIRARI